jgi:hypothetical protein
VLTFRSAAMQRFLLIVAIVFVVSCSQSAKSSDNNNTGEINFLFCDIGFKDDALIEIKIKNPDGKVYSRVGAYGLSDNSVRIFRNKDEQNMDSPRYSVDAKKIIFSIHYSPEKISTAILNVETGGYVEITGGHDVKLRPYFTPDGKGILYWVPELNNFSKRYLFCLYKFDIFSRIETKMTKALYSDPGYIVIMPSKNIIAFGATRSGGSDFGKSYLVNDEYLIGDNNDQLSNRILRLINYGNSPVILSASNSEMICFVAPTNDIVGVGGYFAYNVYVKKNESISQISNYIPGKDRVMIRHAAISRDGKRIIFESFPSVANYAPFYNTFAKFFGAEVSKPSETEFGTFIVNADGSNKEKIVINPPIVPIVNTIHRIK